MSNVIDTLFDSNRQFASTDKAWVQYVKDHREQLLANSKTVAIPASVMAEFKYRPEAFLQDYNISPSATWLVLWINQIFGAANFVNITKLQIPTATYLYDLYDAYNTFTVLDAEVDATLTEG